MSYAQRQVNPLTKPIPASTPVAPAAPPAVGSRLRAQTENQIAMLTMALMAVAVGLAYLYCWANIAREGQRRAKLQSQINNERVVARKLQQQKANLTAPTFIQQRAKDLKMIPPADEKQTISVL